MHVSASISLYLAYAMAYAYLIYSQVLGRDQILCAIHDCLLGPYTWSA